MNTNQYITNVSPERDAVVAMLKKKAMTTAQVAAEFGWSRERAYNILKQLHHAGLVGRTKSKLDVLWGKYKKPPEPQKREIPVHNGTMKGRLSLSYMASPYRAGSMDAFELPSGARA